MAQNSYDGFERGVLQWLDDKQTKEQFGFRVQQSRPHGMKFPSFAEINSPRMVQRGKRSQRPPRRNQTNRASSGPGMQAIFLGSGPRSCGTGVFIPRTEGADHQFSKKPEQRKNIVKKGDEKLEKKKKGDDIYISPEIILPEEWTY